MNKKDEGKTQLTESDLEKFKLWLKYKEKMKEPLITKRKKNKIITIIIKDNKSSDEDEENED